MVDREHVHGLLWSGWGCIGGGIAWFLKNIQAINGVMQFAVLAVSLVAGLIGVRKLLRPSK